MGVAIYSQEFKDGAIKQVIDGGHPVSEVASRLGVSQKSLYTWLRTRGGRSRVAKDGQTMEGLKEEVARLKTELKRTKEERDILRKAAAYFAKASE